ncbi:MAG: SRPBCC family protein [Actinomycetota bacterium]
MEVDVTSDIEIERPREAVATFAADPANATAWYENIVSATLETPGPLAVGSQVAFEARFLGRRLRYTYDVRELVPGERLVMSTEQGPFPMETTYTWEDAPGGTRMTLRNRGQPAGFRKVIGPAMARAMRTANRKDLEALKGLLERQGS